MCITALIFFPVIKIAKMGLMCNPIYLPKLTSSCVLQFLKWFLIANFTSYNFLHIVFFAKRKIQMTYVYITYNIIGYNLWFCF